MLGAVTCSFVYWGATQAPSGTAGQDVLLRTEGALALRYKEMALSRGFSQWGGAGLEPAPSCL